MENVVSVTLLVSLSETDFAMCLANGSVSIFAQQANKEYVTIKASLPASCHALTKLPGSSNRYAFGCSNGIVYSGKVFLSDKLEISVGNELVADPLNKHGIQKIIFGDFDGDGEKELCLFRQGQD